MFQIVKTCGKDSVIPVIMATDALGAGIDTTGNTGTGKSFLNNLYRVHCSVPSTGIIVVILYPDLVGSGTFPWIRNKSFRNHNTGAEF